MANSSINLVDLDVDSMKDSLKTYLKAQPQFSDYDFDGSNMSVLLDILSYNTYHNAFYLNMVVNESYLDSAQLRNSVISHAKELNYVPRSARSAKATIDMTFSANTNIVRIPKGTSFTSTVGANMLTFITADESVHFSSSNNFSISDLPVYEGRETSDQYIINYENLSQRFVITDPDVDTRSIAVSIIEDNSGTELTYTQATTTLGLDDNSKVFFLQPCEDGKYELIFGDNILGRRPKNNSIVTIEYRICNKEDGNGASRFTLDDGFTDFTTSPTVNTVDISRGGAEAESLESIKFYAPRYFQTQERAINTSDYEIILKQRFPEINAIAAYGGEEIVPPRYGKVYISIDISDVEGLPDSKITEYSNFIKARSPLSLDSVFIEPEFLYYSVDTTVKYDINSTNLNPEQVKSLVANKIITYNDTALNSFKAKFKYSKFVHQIDDISSAHIISNDTDIFVYKKMVPTIGVPADVDLQFNLELTEEGSVLANRYDVTDLTAVTSSTFTFNGEKVQIQDDGAGNLRLIKTLLDTNIVVVPDVGTVDYDTGSVKLLNFRADGLEAGQSSIRIYVKPRSKDFETSKNVILALESNELNIDVVAARDDARSPISGGQRI